MANDIETPEQFASTLIAGHLQAEWLIEQRDAAIREPLERRIADQQYVIDCEVKARDGLVQALQSEQAARVAAENSYTNTKAILDELHGYVAQMCQHFGDKLEEVPCDAWRLRDHVVQAVKRIASLEAQLASARWIRCSERLPPLGEWVTVANRERVVQRVAWRLLNTGWWECDLEEYDCAPPGTFLCWQPLPEPPAAQKEG